MGKCCVDESDGMSVIGGENGSMVLTKSSSSPMPYKNYILCCSYLSTDSPCDGSILNRWSKSESSTRCHAFVVLVKAPPQSYASYPGDVEAQETSEGLEVLSPSKVLLPLLACPCSHICSCAWCNCDIVGSSRRSVYGDSYKFGSPCGTWCGSSLGGLLRARPSFAPGLRTILDKS